MQNQKQWSTKLNNPIAKNEYDEFFFYPWNYANIY